MTILLFTIDFSENLGNLIKVFEVPGGKTKSCLRRFELGSEFF